MMHEFDTRPPGVSGSLPAADPAAGPLAAEWAGPV